MKPKIRIAICGEGKTDYGIEDGRGKWQEGPLLPLLRNILSQFEIEFIPIPKHALKDIEKERGFKLGKRKVQENKLVGHEKIIYRILYYIRRQEIQPDLFVYYGDTDKQNNDASYQEAYRAFEKNTDIQSIAVIPFRMIESWLLADEDALSEVTGVPKHKLKVPKNPESLWGKEGDPQGKFPKDVLARVLEVAHMEPGLDIYWQIADAMSYLVLAKNCPISFPPVLKQLAEKDYI